MMYPGGGKTCPRCGCVAFQQHVCNEGVAHAYQTRDFQKEFVSVRAGFAYVWTTFEKWLSTPRGRFAEYLAHH